MTANTQTLIIDLLDCCITRNFWQEILKPYWAQNVTSFIAERWTSPSFQSSFRGLAKALDTLNDAPRFEAPDALAYSEQIIKCIQKDLWPNGLPNLLSQLVLLGMGTHYLETQIHADAINSLRRWHDRGWRIITVSELSSLAQRHLLQSTQAGDLSGLVNYHIPLSTRLPIIPCCALISAREALIMHGRALGYQALKLNRLHGAPTEQPDNNMAPPPAASADDESNVVLDLNLCDLFLNS